MPADTSASRQALRADLRARRRALPPTERIRAAAGLARQLQALDALPTQGYVAGYWAMDGEIALHAWQTQLGKGLVYCLPVLHADGHLRFAPWRPGADLAPNRYGIPEPVVDQAALLDASALSLAVLPLVGFDAACNRLGMGGGWYDRSFAFRQTGPAAAPRLIGAAFSVQQVAAVPTQPWDVTLDAVCTQAGTFHPGIP